MILQNEITRMASQWEVPSDIVDKDWVLGHFLLAFYQVDDHRNKLIFKGGTCLRKCRFSEYRFSEDLDFTSCDPQYKLTKQILQETIKKAESTSGIQFYLEELKDLLYKNKLVGYQVKIKYWGANHSKTQLPPDPQRWLTRIKLEVTLYEKIIFKSEDCQIIHLFSDADKFSDQKIPCYDLKEIIAEKIRALVQRSYSAPRDIFDIWKIKEKFTKEQWKEIKEAFIKKMEFKGHKLENVDDLLTPDSIQKLRVAWERSLVPQIKASELPDFEKVIQDLIELFKKYLG